MKATISESKKRITVKPRTQEGVLGYDIDNNYPNRVKDIVSGSGMGKSCVRLYKKFIYGKGFQNTEFAKAKINRKGLTPDKLLLKLADNLAYWAGFSVHVNYNMLYEISEINFQPFSHVRFNEPDHKTHPDMFAVYCDWSEKNIKKDKIVHINKYNPDHEVIQREVEKAGGWEYYKGQILYFSEEGNEYPLASYDAVLEDMQTDDQTKLYKFRNITTNFMASHAIITSKIQSDDPEADEKSALQESLEQYQGAENANKLILIEKESEEQTFEIQKIEQQSGDKMHEWTETSTRNNIRQAFLIPPVLLMELEGRLGGTSDEMIDATNSYNSTTEDERLVIEETMRELFGRFMFKVNQDENYSIIVRSSIAKADPQKKKDMTEVVKDTALTVEQKIHILVYSYEVAEEDALKMVKPSDQIQSNQTLAEKLQVGGTQSLISILTDPLLLPPMKRGTLKVLFGLTDEQINELIPIV